MKANMFKEMFILLYIVAQQFPLFYLHKRPGIELVFVFIINPIEKNK